VADWPNTGATGAAPLLGCMDVLNPLNCPVAGTFIEFGAENPAVAEVPNGLLLPVGIASGLVTVFQPGLEALSDPYWKLLVGVFEDIVFERVGVDNC